MGARVCPSGDVSVLGEVESEREGGGRVFSHTMFWPFRASPPPPETPPPPPPAPSPPARLTKADALVSCAEEHRAFIIIMGG